MKKFISLTAVIFILICMFSACQATPEEPIVVGKNTELMLEKAENTDQPDIKETRPLKEIVEAPERFVLNKTDGNFSIAADAPITVPEGNEMSIMRVVPGEFTQEQVTAIWDALVGDTEMFYTSAELTKSELEEQIIYAKGRLAQAEDQAEKDEWESSIKVYEQKYLEAPEERITVKTDDTLREHFVTYMYSTEKSAFKGVIADSADRKIQFFARNSYTDIHGRKNRSVLSFSKKDGDEYEEAEGEPKIDRFDAALTDENIPQDAEGLNLSPKEAAEKTQEFLDEANIPFSPVNIALRHDQNSGKWYYLLYCTRNAGDIPSAYLLGETYSERDGDFFETWEYEVMNIRVDDSGVRGFNWEYPLDVIETVVEDSNLMTYLEAHTIFEKMAAITYEYQAKGYDLLTLNIDEVKLETMRILEQNKTEVGLLVPVWNFYGVRERTLNGKTDHTSRMILLSVNAIDGSIIDTVKGY